MAIVTNSSGTIKNLGIGPDDPAGKTNFVFDVNGKHLSEFIPESEYEVGKNTYVYTVDFGRKVNVIQITQPKTSAFEANLTGSAMYRMGVGGNNDYSKYNWIATLTQTNPNLLYNSSYPDSSATPFNYQTYNYTFSTIKIFISYKLNASSLDIYMTGTIHKSYIYDNTCKFYGSDGTYGWIPPTIIISVLD